MTKFAPNSATICVEIVKGKSTLRPVNRLLDLYLKSFRNVERCLMALIKELHVNGAKRPLQADGERTLLEVLREDLQLTGSKYGCGEGRCGACTVLMDGQATRSCQTSAEEAVGKQITTIEGLERNGQLHPLQTAFLENDAMQCGYCTAGMIMSGAALLNQKANPNPEEILTAMQGNVCRCGTYGRIVAAIQQAAQNKGGTTR